MADLFFKLKDSFAKLSTPRLKTIIKRRAASAWPVLNFSSNLQNYRAIVIAQRYLSNNVYLIVGMVSMAGLRGENTSTF